MQCGGLTCLPLEECRGESPVVCVLRAREPVTLSDVPLVNKQQMETVYLAIFWQTKEHLSIQRGVDDAEDEAENFTCSY